MAVTLDDDARRYLATFEEVTGADGKDCILEADSAGAGDGGAGSGDDGAGAGDDDSVGGSAGVGDGDDDDDTDTDDSDERDESVESDRGEVEDDHVPDSARARADGAAVSDRRHDHDESGGRDGDDARDEHGDRGEYDRLIVLVSNGQMGEAIGPGGRTIQQYEDRIDVPVRLVENADDPEAFVANTLAPATVHNVTISENVDTVAYVEVAEDDRGIAIGSNGRTIDAARTLAQRHFGIDDVQLI